MIKIAFLAPEFLPPWGGVGVYSFELMRALSNYNNLDLHVITPVRGKRYDRELKNYFKSNVHVHYISKANDTFFYNLKFQVALLRKFSALHKRHKFDLVHAANLVHMPDIFLKFRKWNIPFLTTIHSTIDGQSRINGVTKYNSDTLASVELLSRITYPYIKFMEKVYLKRTQNFVCVSEWIKKLSGVDGRVIHNGIDERRFSPQKKNNKVPNVLYVGRLLAMKGIDCLIESLRPLLLKKRIKLLILGEGNANKYRKKLSGIDKSYYSFLGTLPYEKIHAAYQNADIFLLPSLTESFPFSILEAMASRVAVVSSNVGGVPEIIEDYKTGLLFEPNNAQQLYEKVTMLLEDSELKKKLETNARGHVEKHLTSTIMAKKTHEVYRELA